MSEQNKALARRLYEEVINERNLELLGDLIADDATGFGNTSARGRDVFVDHIQALLAGIGAARTTVTDLIAEGERVVVYWRLQGRHVGPLWNVPASGNALDGRSVSLITFRAGKIVAYEVMADRHGFLQQMRAPSASSLV